MKNHMLTLKLVLGLVLLQSPELSHASEQGQKLYQKKCTACHSISDNSNISLSQRLQEKAPTLYYAGNKFNAAWLEQWLAVPKRLRPGGHFFLNKVKVTEDGDLIDETKLVNHMTVQPKEAKQITQYLMLQTPKSDLIALEQVTLGKVNRTLGEKDFNKFKGCGSCHQDEDGYGGVSGPELYTAISRLQPNFIASYIRHPEKWDPKTLMPNRHLNDNSIKKLVNYLNVISE